MRYFFLFSFLLISSILFAQQISLQWAVPKKINTIEERSKTLPSFQEEFFYLDRNEMPAFQFSERVNGIFDISIENVTYENVNIRQMGDLDQITIPSSLHYRAKVDKAQNQFTLKVDMNPFIKNGNQIQRVKSFNIVRSNTNKGVVSNNFGNNLMFNRTAMTAQDGVFYKIRVDTTGVYRLDYQFFIENGISTNFNPKSLKIYGNGGMMLPENPGDFNYDGLQENAITFMGEDDNSFDEGDYLLFYAQGPHGIERGNFTNLSNVNHSYNIYEEHSYYFININSPGLGKRVQNSNLIGTPTSTFDTFDQVLFYENDSINVDNVGRQWFGENFSVENSQTFSLPGSGSVQGDIFVDYRFLGVQAANNTVNVTVNSGSGTSGFIGGGGNGEANNSGFFEPKTNSFTATGGYPSNFTVSVDNSANPAGVVYLDFVRVAFEQNLNFSGGQLPFRKLQNLSDGNVYGFNLSGSPQYVWDVTDRTNAKNLSAAGNQYLYQNTEVNFNNEFIAFNESEAYLPEFVSQITPQGLSNLTNIQYLIISHPDFVAQANRIANYHSTNSGVTTTVVSTEQVYNEFSSGSQDIAGIRDFIKFLYEKPTPLRYVLLFGDSSYDFKDRIPNNTNFVPSYQSFVSYGLSATYVTDDFFAAVDDTDSGLNATQSDVAVGRLPAANLDEANLLVNKTLAYQNGLNGQSSPFGIWRTKVHLVVDDDNRDSNPAFHTTVDNGTASFLQNNHPELTVRKLYIDAFPRVGSAGGFRYPTVNEAITNAVETGTMLVNYFGHGGINGWTQERIFSQDDFDAFTNFNTEYTRFPLFMTVTCDFTVWDIPQIISGGEVLIKNPEGGAAAMLTTSREITVSFGTNFNEPMVTRLLQVENNQYLPIGEALRLAKIDVPNGGTSSLSVNLLGDPLMRLPNPPREIEIETINGEPADSFSGVIRALDFVTIEGNVQNIPGTGVDSNFNGTLSAILYDKEVERNTLNHWGDLQELTYTEQVDALFRGKTDVENGEWTLQFYVPKDINFEVGNGKLVLYADNNSTDALTYKNDLLVGDINPNGVDDDEGPIIGLYMNNLNFANGGITNRNPYLLACVVDSTGINATGVGIGHDITELLDSDINTTTVLNEYYEGGDTSPCINPAVQDFQKGRVLYRLRNLELGEHTVTFKVWDINNNSSTETLDFVVMENGEQQLYINRLLNWPNPFTDQTFFHFEHNCDSVLEVQVQIFTVSGKLVKTIRQTVSSAPFREGYRTDKFGIPWDGLDDFGNKIGKGVYIYRTTVKGANPENCKGSAAATEKLVILK